MRCGAASGASFRSRKSPPQYSAIIVSAGLTLGVERYRYPGDLPKVAATSGGANYCDVHSACLSCPPTSCRRSSPVTSARTRLNTGTRASC